jgi:RNA recognition motif-containing protein
MNIYVSHLSFDSTNESLQNLFAEYGQVASANVITDRETGFSRGFAFVEMPNDTEGQKAIDELNGTVFEGKSITVNVARPKTERSNNGGFNNRGGFNKNRY